MIPAVHAIYLHSTLVPKIAWYVSQEYVDYNQLKINAIEKFLQRRKGGKEGRKISLFKEPIIGYHGKGKETSAFQNNLLDKLSYTRNQDI